MTVTQVRVVVFEDDVRIAETDIGYYDDQPYEVQIVTPDGVDARIKRNVGQLQTSIS